MLEVSLVVLPLLLRWPLGQESNQGLLFLHHGFRNREYRWIKFSASLSMPSWGHDVALFWYSRHLNVIMSNLCLGGD